MTDLAILKQFSAPASANLQLFQVYVLQLSPPSKHGPNPLGNCCSRAATLSYTLRHSDPMSLSAADRAVLIIHTAAIPCSY